MTQNTGWTEWVAAARDGDRRAFEALMARFQDAMFALAYARLGDHHRAQDAVQEAFIEAFQNLAQLQIPAAFPAWLRRIVLGKCIRQVRGSKSIWGTLPLQDLQYLISADEIGPERRVETKEAWRELDEALSRLPESEREIMVLYGLGGLSYTEVADQLAVPLGTVKKRLFTARRRLATLLPEYASHINARRPSRNTAGAPRLPLVAVPAGKETQKAMEVKLLDPSEEHRLIIKNLYTFYRYDLMPFIESGSGSYPNRHGVLNGEHSRTHEEGVKGEDTWWEKPGILSAYLITADDLPVGFALVARPPHATRGVDYRLNELFVINKVRRQGVATCATRALFDRLPGRWEVAFLPQNSAAAGFWRRFIPEYAPDRHEESMIGMGVGQPSLPGYLLTTG